MPSLLRATSDFFFNDSYLLPEQKNPSSSRTKDCASAVPPLFTRFEFPVHSFPDQYQGSAVTGFPAPFYLPFRERFSSAFTPGDVQQLPLWGLSACGRSFSISAWLFTPPGDPLIYYWGTL